MMLLNEPFARCDKCDGGWFERNEVYLIHKRSTNNQVIMHEHRTRFNCNACGHTQYEIKNDIKE